jgi:hypothetical protein
MMRGWGPHGHPLGHTGPPDYSGLSLKLSARREKNKVPGGVAAVLCSATAPGKPLRSLRFLSVNRNATASCGGCSSRLLPLGGLRPRCEAEIEITRLERILVLAQRRIIRRHRDIEASRQATVEEA